MKKIIIAGVAILLFSCTAKQVTHAGKKPLYEMLSQQSDGGATIRFFEILTDSKEIVMLRGDKNIKQEITDADLKNANFLILNMGEKKSGGYSIGIEKVEETDEKLIFTVKETEPKPGEMVTQNITYPYAIIKINSKKPIDVN